ncbi:NADP-dependent oxidoreductase [Mucilaginibacter sp. FT3.2]|uniref:NADP-dependent oxidoreductase n=1 Tax=Mucilaginibacter sp. FT3.2 TaxID=2723090 RepID=UPI001618F96F|nr:NADP-dependent oxidoreductase [Mucilaginibacter sp. FT3.2]MBB6233084.1 NADPH:quinone reductase-like Zn-dependent oxidoreductase [Mucilaginibacter sp. FT3.2]
MKAIILKAFGGIDQLQPIEIPVPAIGAGEVLVKLSSISINPVDFKTREGKGIGSRIKDQLPAILGWDISGVITQVGTDVHDFKPGDEVFSMIGFPKLANAYAEYVVAQPNELAIKPANITHDEAAAATLAALTAWQALTTKGNIKKGDKVLIHAASGGVGHYAVQIAKHLGAYVIGTSSAANRDFVLGLGADEHIDYKTQQVKDVVSNVDFILDPLGGDTTTQSLHIAKKGGTVICIVHAFNDALLQKAQELGVNAHNIMVYTSGDDMKTIAGLLEKGIVRSHVSKVFPFEQMGNAHLLLETGRTVGKVVLNF